MAAALTTETSGPLTATVLTAPSPVTLDVRQDPVAGFPRNGDSYLVMSTGDAGILTNPNESAGSGLSLGGGNVRGNTDFDVTIVRIDFSVPSTANCLVGIDFRFLSEEYPEFVGSSFNDAFVVEVDDSTWTTNGSQISAPDNIAFDPSGNPITINASGVTSMNAAEAEGTTFDGATPVLRAATPLTPGPHSLYLSIFDQGDQILDSAVLVDNLQLGAVSNPDDCKPGAVVVPSTQLTIRALSQEFSLSPDPDDEAFVRVRIKVENADGSDAAGATVNAGGADLTANSTGVVTVLLPVRPGFDLATITAELDGASASIEHELYTSRELWTCIKTGRGGNGLGSVFGVILPKGQLLALTVKAFIEAGLTSAELAKSPEQMRFKGWVVSSPLAGDLHVLDTLSPVSARMFSRNAELTRRVDPQRAISFDALRGLSCGPQA